MSGGRILLLGLGMQGKAALYDLVNNSNVSDIIVVDNSADLPEYLSCYPSDKVSYHNIDATNNKELSPLLCDVDVIVESLPGTFALPIGKLAVKMGVNLVSSVYYLNPGEKNPQAIQSMREQIHHLDVESKEKGITILTEFGLDPGIDLVLGARALGEMDEPREFYSYGAGLPAVNAMNNPLKYKFSWSVSGVMRAYNRPAVLISDGEALKIEAKNIFDTENYHVLELKEIGIPLECYPNGDSVYYANLFGIKDSIREMARYTCRYPGHCAFWEIITKSGFIDNKPVKVGDNLVSPIEFTASLLSSQKQFQYADEELDLTLVRVDVRGIMQGKKKRIIYKLIDKRDLKTGFTSMQRTVGFTMSLGARLILEGKLQKTGLLSPLDVPFDLVVEGLRKQNIQISRQEIDWK